MVAFNHDQKPEEPVLEWCRELVRAMKDGGVWGIPRSGTVFQMDQKNKRLICRSLGPDNDDGDFLATQRVFAHIGWDVVMADEVEET